MEVKSVAANRRFMFVMVYQLRKLALLLALRIGEGFGIAERNNLVSLRMLSSDSSQSQAIDLGSRVDRLPQSCVAEVCRASMALKTGALMVFAMVLGGAIGGATKETIFALDEFGRELGVALQMFDDLGNVLGIREPSKRYEDLTLCRPSWAWACAAKTSSPNGYQQFVSAVNQIPDARELEAWVDRHHLIQTMRDSAPDQLESAYNRSQSAGYGSGGAAVNSSGSLSVRPQRGSADGMRRKLGKMSYSMSLFLIYFGTNRKFSNLVHHKAPISAYTTAIATFAVFILSGPEPIPERYSRSGQLSQSHRSVDS
jgi:Polyprenyl synthetase